MYLSSTMILPLYKILKNKSEFVSRLKTEYRGVFIFQISFFGNFGLGSISRKIFEINNDINLSKTF